MKKALLIILFTKALFACGQNAGSNTGVTQRSRMEGDEGVMPDSGMKPSTHILRSALPKLAKHGPIAHERLHGNPAQKRLTGTISRAVKKTARNQVSAPGRTINSNGNGNAHAGPCADITAAAIRAIAEQQTIIDRQQQAIDSLQAQLNTVKKSIEDLAPHKRKLNTSEIIFY